MTNPDFAHADENYAYWMRECLIYRINQISGRDKDETVEATKTHFFLGQMDTQKIRQRTTQVYHSDSRLRPDQTPPLWCYGAAFHHFFVEKSYDIKDVLAYKDAKLSKKARAIHKAWLKEQSGDEEEA